jgi:2-haloacid dehalogenase
MPRRPLVIAFDVVETLFSLEQLGRYLETAGLPPDGLPLFFSQMLRDAIALDAAGTFKPFAEVAAATLGVIMANHGVRGGDGAAAEVVAHLAELPAHPDVQPALERAHAAGLPLVTLTNGSAANTRTLLSRAAVRDLVAKIISIDEVGHWKPHRDVYLHAVRSMRVEPDRMALVAAHAWDTHGAKQAGLVTGWVQRHDRRYSAAMSPPDVRGGTLVEVVEGLLALPDSR